MGELYLRQATVIAAIGIFAGVWWLVIGIVEKYERWREPYVAVMAVAVACELLAFVAPLWSFHQIMAADKRRHLSKADLVSREILHLEGTLSGEGDQHDENREAEIERLRQRWRDIETMPTWPVDARLRRRFTWNQVAVLIPVTLKALSAPRWWQELGEGLGRLLT